MVVCIPPTAFSSTHKTWCVLFCVCVYAYSDVSLWLSLIKLMVYNNTGPAAAWHTHTHTLLSLALSLSLSLSLSIHFWDTWNTTYYITLYHGEKYLNHTNTTLLSTNWFINWWSWADRYLTPSQLLFIRIHVTLFLLYNSHFENKIQLITPCIFQRFSAQVVRFPHRTRGKNVAPGANQLLQDISTTQMFAPIKCQAQKWMVVNITE